MKAWLFQDHKQKQKLGDKCPWSVGWVDPDGKRRSKRIGSKSRAEKFCRRIEGQLAAGTYEGDCRRLWSEFRCEYDVKILKGMEPATRVQTKLALKQFERIVKPQRMRDHYGRHRRFCGKATGGKKGQTEGVATGLTSDGQQGTANHPVRAEEGRQMALPGDHARD